MYQKRILIRNFNKLILLLIIVFNEKFIYYSQNKIYGMGIEFHVVININHYGNHRKHIVHLIQLGFSIRVKI